MFRSRRLLRWLTNWWWVPTALLSGAGGVLLSPSPPIPQLPPLTPLPASPLPTPEPLPQPALAPQQTALPDYFQPARPPAATPTPPSGPPQQTPTIAPVKALPNVPASPAPINPLQQWAQEQELRLVASSLGIRRSASLASRWGIITLLEGESPVEGIQLQRVEAQRVIFQQGQHRWAVGW